MAKAPKNGNNGGQQQGGITPAAAIPMTMVHGFAVQIIGFIPIPKDDLRKQAEIPLLLLDIQEGKKTLADLVPHLRGVESRQQYLGRRVTTEEAAAWRKDPAQTDIEDFTNKGGEGGEQKPDDADKGD